MHVSTWQMPHDGAADLVLHIEFLLSQAFVLLPRSYLNSLLKGNFQLFIAAPLFVISCIMAYLDNILIISSTEDEFAEWLMELSWTFGMSHAWVKKAISVILLWYCIDAHHSLILKSRSSRHFRRRSKLQFRNTGCSLRTLKFKIWNYEMGELAKI